MKDNFIGRQTALKGLEDLNIASFYELNEHSKEAYHEIKQMLEALPVVDAEPVRHGQWIDETFAPWGLVHHPYKCDQCGDHSEAPSCYCPNCGAKMDGRDDKHMIK